MTSAVQLRSSSDVQMLGPLEACFLQWPTMHADTGASHSISFGALDSRTVRPREGRLQRLQNSLVDSRDERLQVVYYPFVANRDAIRLLGRPEALARGSIAEVETGPTRGILQR